MSERHCVKVTPRNKDAGMSSLIWHHLAIVMIIVGAFIFVAGLIVQLSWTTTVVDFVVSIAVFLLWIGIGILAAGIMLFIYAKLKLNKK